jgi:hypothetical protein
VYNTFPIFAIEFTSTKFSQLLLEASSIVNDFGCNFAALAAEGNRLLISIEIIIPKGILLLLLFFNSLILMLISIRINKNKIDTAPTYIIK